MTTHAIFGAQPVPAPPPRCCRCHGLLPPAPYRAFCPACIKQRDLDSLNGQIAGAEEDITTARNQITVLELRIADLRRQLQEREAQP